MTLPLSTGFRLPGPRILAGLLGLVLLWLPAPVGAAVTCSFSGTTLSVILGGPQDAASVVRAGTEIEVRAGSTLLNCGGTPEVDSVDSITASDTSNGTTTFTIDLAGGPFEPGATTTGEGTSPEIEFQVDLTGQFPDRLGIVGTGGPDAFSFS
jgi:hypothetical protein